ncbi:MAG TPA: helix-turn-helix domain-containing protein [Caulobacteraceae bacterium]|nr:helix-turn-helix domain-containing protein [Caulobacteraceae bacterium]
MAMSKKNFERLLKSVEQAAAFERGEAGPNSYRVHVPERIDVKAVRAYFGLSQAEFAQRFGFTVSTVREWEQGRRRPEASARVLLKVIEKEPEAVLRALVAT